MNTKNTMMAVLLVLAATGANATNSIRIATDSGLPDFVQSMPSVQNGMIRPDLRTAGFWPGQQPDCSWGTYYSNSFYCGLLFFRLPLPWA